MASSHLPHRGETFQTFENWKEKHGGATRRWGFPRTRTNTAAARISVDCRTRKECELGRAASDFDILKNRDSRKGGRLGQVTLLSGARTTRLFQFRWSVNNDFPLVSDQIYLTFARPRGFVPGLSPEARREAVKRFPSFRFF